MRILQLCNKPPLPAIDGGCLAMHSITEGLLDAGHEVMVFAIVTPKHPLVKEKIPADYFSKTKFESEFIDTTVKAGAAVINLFSGSSLNVDRFYSSGAEQKIKNILVKNAFDIVILESIYMSPYIDVIRKNSKAKIVLRSHNVEHLLWEDRARTGKDLLKRKWFSSLAKKMKSAEVYALNNTDAFLAITTDDQKILSSFTPKSSITIPFALKFEGHDSIAKMYKKTVFHIGAMDWLPNIQGVQWFIDNV
ncbi:MAG TPA: hypothetical protein VL651_09260, partial [Bacteroidia bacterium]|nr:hypothetical protein [Bacteroidia bacterium]